jgi:hypothetical protein
MDHLKEVRTKQSINKFDGDRIGASVRHIYDGRLFYFLCSRFFPPRPARMAELIFKIYKLTLENAFPSITMPFG